jgi:hypothetical protein
MSHAGDPETLAAMKNLIASTVIGLALVACGPASHAAQPSPTPNVAAIVRELMDCIHTHGAPDFPDPAINDQGKPEWPEGTQRPPQSVIDACQSIYDRLPNSEQTHELTPDELHLAQQFAQCMRDQGYPDWPDPNKDGTYPLPDDITAEGKSPHLLSAWQACARFNPSGHISAGRS